jgi:hypothetical protein
MGRERASDPTRRIRRVAIGPVGMILVTSLLVAACGAGTASPSPADVSPSPAATPMPSADPDASPRADVTVTSKRYPYTLTVPGDAVAIAPTLATAAWDGTTRIDSADAHTDWLGFEGDRTFFVYGAPIDTSLADFAASSQAQVAEWHGCPDTPESTADVTVGGAPGRLHLFHCQGLLVMKLMTVANGFGLVLNQIGPDADPAAEQALLLGRIADLSWTN